MPLVSSVSKRLRKIAKGESFAYGLLKHTDYQPPISATLLIHSMYLDSIQY